MKTPHARRAFLEDVGRGMLVAALGPNIAANLGLGSDLEHAPAPGLSFGSLEPLVCLMQETPADRLLPVLARERQAGTDLRRLVAAAALANARSFGGEDYVGFHTMMALAPALHMAGDLPPEHRPLPVFKVLYRNTQRIQEHGGRQGEVLQPAAPLPNGLPGCPQDALREAVRRRDVGAAEQIFAGLSESSAEEALNSLLLTVQDDTEVHRVVLPYRAWDLLGLIGKDQAHTLLRQSVRYCVRAESWSRQAARPDAPRVLLPRLLEEYRLLDRSPGDRPSDDAWVEEFSQTVFAATPAQAAEAAASALAEGMTPAAVGEAVTLAANQLVLRDHGRRPQEESSGKPVGSVHGDSIGVHACDSANAWRNLARVSNPRNGFASLILGAYQVAHDRKARGGDFLNWEPLPVRRHLDEVKGTDQATLLREADEAIRGNLQARASALVARYGELGHDPRRVFDLLLRYGVSEDGSLHAEKFFRTVSEEFATTRPAFRWRHLVALARVTASEFGRPAAGMAEARQLLGIS